MRGKECHQNHEDQPPPPPPSSLPIKNPCHCPSIEEEGLPRWQAGGRRMQNNENQRPTLPQVLLPHGQPPQQNGAQKRCSNCQGREHLFLNCPSPRFQGPR